MRFPVFEHDAQPGIHRPLLRKSFAYCQDLVAAGTHYWLPTKKDGIKAFPPPKPIDDSSLESCDQGGSLDYADAINNATGAADENRVALRPEGRLSQAESLAMRKFRNYRERDKRGRLIPEWADRIVPMTAEKFASALRSTPSFA